jgi:hypothetical protein
MLAAKVIVQSEINNRYTTPAPKESEVMMTKETNHLVIRNKRKRKFILLACILLGPAIEKNIIGFLD